jgi:alkylation response protein AidB-like acyl-CoA dehydrogenase
MSQHTPSIEPTLLPPDTAELWLPPLPPSLGFGPEHQLLRESARRFLSEKSPTSTVRALAEDTVGFDRAVYREMADLGWLDYRSRPDEDGSLGPLHVALLLEEMGRRLLPSPYLSSLLALSLLERADDCEVVRALRARIASGDAVVSIAWCEPADGGELARVQTRATLAEVGFALHGEKCHVHWGHAADVVLLPCREPKGTIGVFALELPADGALVEPEVCVDSTRRTARLSLDGVRVRREARLPVDGLEALRALEIAGAALLSAEMVGAADAVLELTRAYAIERTQFGRAIGSFQALQHRSVDLYIQEQLSSCVLADATEALDERPGEPTTAAIVSRAKARCSDAASVITRQAIQMHGAIGFTEDSDVGLYVKRALVLSAWLGNSAYHRRRYNRLAPDDTE